MMDVEVKKISLWLVCLLFFFSSNGQTLHELRKEKEKTSQEIDYINSLLKETDQHAKSSINRLSMLDQKIRLQERLISNINSEMNSLDSTISRISGNIDSLNSDLVVIKNRYASMIRYARRNQRQNNQLLFIFSADDFNQAYKRFSYLKQYAGYRRSQVSEINVLKGKLAAMMDDLNTKKSEKEKLRASKISQSESYTKQKEDQKIYYSTLQKKEKELRKKLENQQKIALRLEQEIEKCIAEEVKKAAAQTGKVSGNKPSPELRTLSDNFASNRGKLPWPLQKGVITDHFGEHPDQFLKYVVKRNSGIDITTQTGAKARAVFRGEVSRVLAIPGGNWAIIIRHGSYLTVYSNLGSVIVQAGQKVETRQELGTVFTDHEDDNKTVLKFQLRNENTKLDPEEWISR